MSKEKKNRFYYSFSQDCVSQRLGELDEYFEKIDGVRENFVLTPNGWEKYTEWCSLKNSKCNWEDAKLVFETDESPEIKIVYRKTTQLVAKELELILTKEKLKQTEKALELACDKIADMLTQNGCSAWFYDFDGNTVIERDGFEDFYKRYAQEMLKDE